MMRVLIDSNIILDVLLNRKEFLERSSAILKLLNERKFNGFIAATTVTNMYYIVRKVTGKPEEAMMAVNKTLQWCKIALVNRETLEMAQSFGMKDFEDAVQTAAAKVSHIDIVVTRDKKGFLDSGLQVYSPEEFLEALE